MEKLELLIKKANNGDGNAMIEVGNYYYLPLCDFEKALYWYKKAYENGNNDALIFIAQTYEQLDLQKAAHQTTSNNKTIEYELSENTMEWYMKALNYCESDLENMKNIYIAAELLSSEDAIQVDFNQAFQYYQMITNNQDSKNKVWIKLAQANLAKMYELGLGCEKDMNLSNEYKNKSNIDETSYQEIKFYHQL